MMPKRDYSVALFECHFMNPEAMHEMAYYPGFAMDR